MGIPILQYGTTAVAKAKKAGKKEEKNKIYELIEPFAEIKKYYEPLKVGGDEGTKDWTEKLDKMLSLKEVEIKKKLKIIRKYEKEQVAALYEEMGMMTNTLMRMSMHASMGKDGESKLMDYRLCNEELVKAADKGGCENWKSAQHKYAEIEQSKGLCTFAYQDLKTVLENAEKQLVEGNAQYAANNRKNDGKKNSRKRTAPYNDSHSSNKSWPSSVNHGYNNNNYGNSWQHRSRARKSRGNY